MNDELFVEHVKHACERGEREGIAILWHSATFNDPLHAMRLKSLEIHFDVIVGGVVRIGEHTWRLLESKRPDKQGWYVYLERTDKESCSPTPKDNMAGMVTKNRPKTKEEWSAWHKEWLSKHNVTLRPASPPIPSRPDYSASFEGAREAEGN